MYSTKNPRSNTVIKSSTHLENNTVGCKTLKKSSYMDHPWGRGSRSAGGLIHPSVDTAPSPVVALASDCSVAGRSATIYFLILLVTTTCLENHLQLSRRQQVCQVTTENKHTGTYWPCWVCSASQAQEKVFLVPLKWFLITVSSGRGQGAVI